MLFLQTTATEEDHFQPGACELLGETITSPVTSHGQTVRFLRHRIPRGRPWGTLSCLDCRCFGVECWLLLMELVNSGSLERLKTVVGFWRRVKENEKTSYRLHLC